MANAEFRLDPGQTLQPAETSYMNRKAPHAFGPSLNILKGQAMGKKTSDNKLYPLNIVASDGTQTFYGFSEYSLGTDASGNVFFVFGGSTAAATFYGLQTGYSSVYTGGVFTPNDVFTAATGTPVAEVDTVTPAGTITAADNFVIELPGGNTVNFVAVSGSVTPTNIVTGLKASWAADPVAAALATASGTATLVLTAVTAGSPMNLTTYCEGVGTFVKVITTPAVAAQQAEVDTFTLAGTIATGDVYTATITYPNNTTKAVTATVGATTTATAIDLLLIAAWNGDPQTADYATASGTATFILTGTKAGSALSVVITSSGAGTITKVVTKAAFGASLADIQISRPGAYVQPNGRWAIP